MPLDDPGTEEPLERWTRWLVLFIAATTIVAGVVQLVAPGFVLRFLDASSTQTTRHFFAIVGMFMAVIGGLLLHTLLSRADSFPVLLWAGIQKFGAFVAVTLGVLNDVFSGLGVAVAINDLLSAGVILWYLRLRTARTSPTTTRTEARAGR